MVVQLTPLPSPLEPAVVVACLAIQEALPRIPEVQSLTLIIQGVRRAYSRRGSHSSTGCCLGKGKFKSSTFGQKDIKSKMAILERQIVKVISE